MDVQRQSGSCDCGLYAIAFGTAVAFADDPTNCLFDQVMMRSHLYSCLEAGRMKMFPHKKIQPNRKNIIKNNDDFQVYCRCRMPEVKGGLMIECSNCRRWYHVYCENVPDKVVDKTEIDWFCQDCLSKIKN